MMAGFAHHFRGTGDDLRKLLAEQHLVYDDEAAIMSNARDALRELDSLFDADAAQSDAPRGGDQPAVFRISSSSPGFHLSANFGGTSLSTTFANAFRSGSTTVMPLP